MFLRKLFTVLCLTAVCGTYCSNQNRVVYMHLSTVIQPGGKLVVQTGGAQPEISVVNNNSDSKAQQNIPLNFEEVHKEADNKKDNSQQEPKTPKVSYFQQAKETLGNITNAIVNPIFEYPKTAITTMWSLLGIGSWLVYKTKPEFKNKVDDNYDHAHSKYLEYGLEVKTALQKKLTKNNVALALAAGYGLKKLNDYLDITGIAKDGMSESYNYLKTVDSNTWVNISLGAFLTGAAFLAYESSKRKPTYKDLLNKFWKKFDVEQRCHFSPEELIDLTSASMDNPAILLKNNKFLETLSEKQKMDLEKIIQLYNTQEAEFIKV